jgi:hypothetical protein
MRIRYTKDDHESDAFADLNTRSVQSSLVRGRLPYMTGEYAPGTTRFVVERILTWDSGELLYSEIGET